MFFLVNNWKSSKTLWRLKCISRWTLISSWGKLFLKVRKWVSRLARSQSWLCPFKLSWILLALCRHNDDEELLVQLDVFEEQRLEDEDDLSSPEGVNLTSHLDVFHALFRKVCFVLSSLAFLWWCKNNLRRMTSLLRAIWGLTLLPLRGSAAERFVCRAWNPEVAGWSPALTTKLELVQAR